MNLEGLKAFYNAQHIYYDEPMCKHTSFKIGGPANAVVIPNAYEQIVNTISYCEVNKIPYYIMGNGSNILVDDQGIQGVVIKISENMSQVSIEDDELIVEAGALLSYVSRLAFKHSLQGFEFASGIPGTIGGAIFMNAGAYGGEMKDVVSWVEVLTKEMTIERLTNDQLNFGYRTSSVKENGLIILRCGLKLCKGDKEIIREITNELTAKRVSKQPLDLPSAGSTFKRPEGHFAGQLIENAGLRGLRHGDAQVSEKHCGFIVNRGNATCKQVVDLIQVIQKVVYDTFGVELEREVRIFGKE